jgi:hypothetical protein
MTRHKINGHRNSTKTPYRETIYTGIEDCWNISTKEFFLKIMSAVGHLFYDVIKNRQMSGMTIDL